MKKLLVLATLLPLLATAQKNVIKVNASSLVLRNYNFTYERKILPKSTLSLGIRIMPKGKLPFQDVLEKYAGLDDPNLNIGRFEIGGTAITPEFRFYLGRKAMRGFYIAPYARYASIDLRVPIKYTYTSGTGNVTREADFTGKIKSFSGGVMLGTQYSFSRFVVDIWLIGGHYGSSNGNLNAAIALNSQEQQSLRNSLESFDPSPFKYEYDVNANGATLKSTGPWAGVRTLGVNFGIKF
jgi:hypothetical protein